MKLAILFICIFLGYGIGRESSPAFVVLLLSVLSIFIVKSISKDDRELEVGRKYYRGNVPRVSDKSRVVAFSLCLFLGYLGIHCFYSGKIAKGILYIFTFGLFGFGWLYDLIQIVLGKSTDRSGARLI
ncbi:MAG: TM2 domain-containing protein [Clostridiales bacterium]|nr:TM2 domain-containing protein [Candidatus Blautia equi]